jgi:hypothetical protein
MPAQTRSARCAARCAHRYSYLPSEYLSEYTNGWSSAEAMVFGRCAGVRERATQPGITVNFQSSNNPGPQRWIPQTVWARRLTQRKHGTRCWGKAVTALLAW